MAPTEPGGPHVPCRMLVAAHRASDVPHDRFYLPIHCGHALNPIDLGFQPDDDGESISERNREYSELTALYWAWKNLRAETIGLSHYRRYFRGTLPGPGGTRILSGGEAQAALDGVDIVLARPRNYLVETLESHYANAHYASDLDALRAAVQRVSPETSPAVESVLGGRRLSQFQMFLMRREELDQYCGWLFAVLEDAERHIDPAGRTSYQRRAPGFLGERLLNVWVTHRKLTVRYLPVVTSEREAKLTKALRLLRRKVQGADRAHGRER